MDNSWFQRFIRAAWRASMALDWTCWAASSWSLRAVMLVMPSCWKACRPASKVSYTHTHTHRGQQNLACGAAAVPEVLEGAEGGSTCLVRRVCTEDRSRP